MRYFNGLNEYLYKVGIKGLDKAVTVGKSGDNYDYVCSNYADDALCIQAAINAAVATNKKAVLVYPGDYQIPTNTNIIEFKSNVDIIGMGSAETGAIQKGTVRFIGGNSKSAHDYSFEFSGNNIRIANIKFDWHSAANDWGSLIRFQTTTYNITFDNCAFYRTGSVGAYLFDVAALTGNIKFRHCGIDNTMPAIFKFNTGSAAIIITEFCDLITSLQIADITDSGTVTAKHCYLESTTASAFKLSSATANLNLQNCTVASNSNSAATIDKLSSGHGNVVINCSVIKNAGSGGTITTALNALSVTGEAYDNTISGLTATNVQAAIDELAKPSNAIYVDKSGNDATAIGTEHSPFLTIDAAYNYAATLVPTATAQALIRIGNGSWDETVTIDTDYINFEGNGTKNTFWYSTSGVCFTLSTTYTKFKNICFKRNNNYVNSDFLGTGIIFEKCRFELIYNDHHIFSFGGAGSASSCDFIDCEWYSAYSKYLNRGFAGKIINNILTGSALAFVEYFSGIMKNCYMACTNLMEDMENGLVLDNVYCTGGINGLGWGNKPITIYMYNCTFSNTTNGIDATYYLYNCKIGNFASNISYLSIIYAYGTVLGDVSTSGVTVNLYNSKVGTIGSGVIVNGYSYLDTNNQFNLAIGASINEFSTDTTMSGSSDDAVPTEKAVKAYTDTEAGKCILVAGTRAFTGAQSFGDFNITNVGEIACDKVIADDATTLVLAEATGQSRIDITSAGVRLGGAGARVTSITDDDALGTSDTILCTQGNVKAYVDTAIGGIPSGGGKVPIVFELAGTLGTGNDQTLWWIAPVAGIISVVKGVLKTVSSAGGPVDIDICKSADNGATFTTIFGTRLTIDDTERSSETAFTPAALNAAQKVITAGEILRLDIIDHGTGAKNLTVVLSMTL